MTRDIRQEEQRYYQDKLREYNKRLAQLDANHAALRARIRAERETFKRRYAAGPAVQPHETAALRIPEVR